MSELFPFCDDEGDMIIQGGGENHMYALSRELAHNNDVAVLTSSVPSASYPSDRFPFYVHTVPNRKTASHRSEDLRFALRLAKALRRFGNRFEVILPQTFIPILSAFLSRPHASVVPIIHDVYQPLPLINGISAWKDLQGGSTMRGIQGCLLERICLHYASTCPLVLTVSDTSLAALQLWVPREKMRVTGNGVYLDEFKQARKDIDLIAIARFDAPYKNIDLLCDAVVNTDIRTIIVGDGRLRPKIEQRYGGRNIEFTGFVSEKIKRELLARSKVLVSASAIEGFGITLVEGLASGCLVAATDIGPHRFIDRGFNVIRFFSVGDSQALKEAVTKLLVLSDAERTELHRRANQLITQYWQWSVIAQKTDLFLRSIS
ncbi:MAG: glycosyltransferase family 4 protein [Euryarchaeota archaeon]|nr:glycosyltransferase family 4 protein [Euryarchaeota archaeon]